MGGSNSTQGSAAPRDASQSNPPPPDYPKTSEDDEDTHDAKITRTIEWDFDPDNRHYSPTVEAFGLKWYCFHIIYFNKV